MSTELLMCGRGVRSILLLPLVARCLETSIWQLFVFMSVVVTVCGSHRLWECLLCNEHVFLALEC